ncbi:MAG TPA: hypothetical protein VJN88_08840 [Ktedonobacterales bacterium]|nr:hypothetical protein [Ktedonobacterales bacterium]
MRTSKRAGGATPLVVALVLTVCALSGLAVGGLARGLSGAGGSAKTSTRTATSGGASGNTPGSATATATESATAVPSGPFTLTVLVSPHVAAPGAQLVVTVTARSSAGNAPLTGLQCVLRAPSDGVTPLLSAWPAPAVTNGDGVATWTVLAPNAAGRYELEAYAQGQHGAYYKYDASVIVSG